MSLSHNEIVNQMPVLRVGVHPGCLVMSSKVEYGVGDKKIMLGAGLKKQ